ncbi:MAG: hypothetical protein ACI379_14335 [Nocardioides sp.]|uniref:hypothetical protein n=1 Tax=Nocardioides sp. TaxID=35761 RepID=UPI003F0E04AC
MSPRRTARRTAVSRTTALAGATALTGALLAGGLLTVTGTAAHADCAGPFDGTGDHVFSGIAEKNDGPYTRFSVQRVWEGDDLAADVWVLAGQEQAPWPLSLLVGVSSSVDAEFEVGQQYVVGTTEEFATNVCQVATLDELSVPEDARQPVAGGEKGAELPMGPLGRTVLVVGVVGGLVLLFRALRRRVHGPR